MFEQKKEFAEICTKMVGQHYKFKKLKGGINNAVYLINNEKDKYVLKKIINNKSSDFDKYIAEKQFFELTTKIGGINTPKLIKNFDKERILILEYIEVDEKKEKLEINDNTIKECIEFIKRINQNKRLGKLIVKQRAADCYLDLIGHIKNIETSFVIY